MDGKPIGCPPEIDKTSDKIIVPIEHVKL